MYPSGLPSNDMKTIWNSGEYTPELIVSGITNDSDRLLVSPFTNSIGKNISLVQNYANSHYIGRENSPIESGYINTIVTPTYSVGRDIRFDGKVYQYPNLNYTGNYIDYIKSTRVGWDPRTVGGIEFTRIDYKTVGKSVYLRSNASVYSIGSGYMRFSLPIQPSNSLPSGLQSGIHGTFMWKLSSHDAFNLSKYIIKDSGIYFYKTMDMSEPWPDYIAEQADWEIFFSVCYEGA